MVEDTLEPQSFFTEQLTKAMLAQPDAVQRAFALAVGETPEQRRRYYADKVGQLSGTLEATDLWDHQKQDIRNALKHIENAECDPTAITVIPTGGGKTRIFQEETNALAIPVKVNDKTVKVTPRIIQLFPTNQLIRQTKKKYAESFPGLQVGEANGRKLDIKPLTLMTYDLFEEWAADGRIKPGDIDMLVMDEAHRGLSDSRQDAIKPFLKNTIVRAFTATPVFDTEKNVYTLLGQENEVSRFTYDELIAAGHIAPIVNPVLKIRLKGTLPENAEERQKLLRELFEQELLDFYLNFKDEQTGERLFGRSFVGYVNTIERAKQMAEYFEQELKNAMGNDASLQPLLQNNPAHLAEHISGENSTKEQDALIERIKTGQTLGVFNAQWMVEGTDIQNLGATLRSPTSSLVVEVQSGGRAGRINPAWPKDDPRQTSFVTDVCFELNGKIIGKPRFFFEAINAPSLARVVQTPVIDIDEKTTGAGGGGRKKPKRKAEDYEVLDPNVAVNHLLKLRDEGQYPKKTPEWWAAADVRDKPSGNTAPVTAAITTLADAFARGEGEVSDDGIATLMYNDKPVHVQKMQAGSHVYTCYLGADLEAIFPQLKEKLPDRTDDWWPVDSMAKRPGGRTNNMKKAVPKLKASYEAEEGEVDADGIRAVPYGDKTVRMRRMSKGQHPDVLCVNLTDMAAAFPELKVAAELPEKKDGDDWWADSEINAMVNGNLNVVMAARKKLAEDFAKGAGTLVDGIRGIPYKDKTVRMQKMQSGSTQPICFHKQDMLALFPFLGTRFPTQTDQWWTTTEAGRSAPGRTENATKVRGQLIEEFEAGTIPLGIVTLEYDGLPVRMRVMEALPRKPVCFQKDDIQALQAHVNEKYPSRIVGKPAPAKELKSLPDIKPRKGTNGWAQSDAMTDRGTGHAEGRGKKEE